ncbi:MAG: hypothetical protein DME76_19310 [Verrucomicrobia bacterium]|nr:MAG: hypothetical protein DME76_19310 [Verrucomicrobiota bacterium]
MHSDTLLDSLRNAGVEPNGIKRKVLVVDDDPNTLKIARTALQSSGYHAVCHASPTGGLAAAANSELDAVILDLLMPEMDGFEFLERLRQLAHYKNIPVIVWTNKDITMGETDRLKRSAQSIALKGRDNIDAVIRELQRHLTSGAHRPGQKEIDDANH